ncbi:MAG: hypothetical protein JSV20_04380 [Candidatus Bathyarchaeota archaeon]|nr:MAG: hypothetical protein JSV20_04380 [Candidatus Bathyarchaeota archaeon]
MKRGHFTYPNYYNRHYRSTLRSIVSIASKHNLDLNLLFRAFGQALKNKVSHCGRITIQCRVISQDSATFLITNKNEIVSQFPIKLETLEAHLSEYEKTHYSV